MEAYEALRASYAAQLQQPVELEDAGVDIHGAKMTVETLPVDSPWRDKIENWAYPAGKSAYVDGPQATPEEVLEVMRAAAAERDEAERPQTERDMEVAAMQEELSDMSDDEFDAFVDELLSDAPEDDDGLPTAILEEVEEQVEEEEEEDYEPVAEVEDEVEESYPDAEAIAEEIAALRESLEGLAFNNEEE